ncbi:Brp/Blh family beta-carotene 15,15'-dioxygenase [Sphingomonas morindae]|uniref:Probable beta-carotene 15,15'-dioxygenase n=1 Tax=Sphingomonas morindae TaxID=1541170 RepID=A0ABY4XA04_9SPHN|nr:Brp/Blh family beta-carotene 15,15'-dioxygenase [Sphingomonas morindae]USI73535.1 Brp/Blh family beta-carotene 15,15'-dioxygenase [Sphingomonas morindae]
MKRGIALLVMGAVAVFFAPLPMQLAFAILGIGVVGMIHGAGDLAVIRREQKMPFLGLYGLVSLVTLAWWILQPSVALPAFLVASAFHFGFEDAPKSSSVERVSRGTALIAMPATLHVGSYADLLRLAGGEASALPTLTPVIAIAGGISGCFLLLVACRHYDTRLATGAGALLLLPPLIGFTVGFLVLHALPQTAERRDRLGCHSTRVYLRTVMPIFLAAVLLAGAVAGLLLHFDPSGVRCLFAGIAALAVPHLLVTPWFEDRSASTSGRPADLGSPNLA